MPIVVRSAGHKSTRRQQILDYILPFVACVARLVKSTEIRATPAAQAAMDTEYNRLRNKKHLHKPGCWDEDLVEEMASVKHRARSANITMRFGMIFGI